MLFFSINVSGQIKMPTGSAGEIKTFMESQTYIVKENKLISDFNIEIVEAAKKHWDITDYEIITATEFKEKRKNEKASFVYINPVYFDEDKTNTIYEYLFLSMGDKSGKLSRMTDLCAVPLSVKGEDQSEFVYKTGLILKFMQKHVKVSKQYPGKDGKDIIDFYVSQNNDFSGKELWLLKDELDNSVNTVSEIKQVFPNAVKFVSKEDIKNAVNSEKKNVLILHLIKAGKNKYCFKIITSAHDADLYYYDYHKIKDNKPSVFLKKDFKKLEK